MTYSKALYNMLQRPVLRLLRSDAERPERDFILLLRSIASTRNPSVLLLSGRYALRCDLNILRSLAVHPERDLIKIRRKHPIFSKERQMI